MAFFGVTIETIDKILPIKDADKIVLCTLKGIDFQFVVAKDAGRKEGDRVLYFPLDSLLTTSIAEKLGLAGKVKVYETTEGEKKHRIRTVKLRGQISQGVMGDLSMLDGMPEGTDITAFLGVTKYEPEEVLSKGGNIRNHPDGIERYDIEGCQRNREVVDMLMDRTVVIAEKLEGANFYAGVTKEGTKIVGQRSGAVTVADGASHTWWDAAKSNHLLEAAEKIQMEMFPGKDVYIRGELCGPKIQGNYYKFNIFTVLAFDIKVDGEYIGALGFLSICQKYNIATVPIISKDKTLREWLGDRNVIDASDGKSMLIDKPREGIVIKPLVEEYCKQLGGRLIIKQRGPIYLSKEE